MSKLSDDMQALRASNAITDDDVAAVDRVTGAAGVTPEAYDRSTHETPGAAIARVASSGALSSRGRSALEAEGPKILAGTDVVSATAIDAETTEIVIARPVPTETWQISHNLNLCIAAD